MHGQRPLKQFPFAALSLRDTLLLWAARMWADASAERPTMPPCVGTAFDIAGIPEASAHLNALLTAMTTSRQPTVEFSPVHCPSVSPAEARFLTAINAARHRACEAYAVSLLTRGIDGCGATSVLASARTVSRLFYERLQPGRGLATNSGVAAGEPNSACPDRGITLVH